LEASKRVYVCRTCSGDFNKGDILYFCLKCKEKGSHEHKLEKMKGLKTKDKGNMDEEDKENYLDQLMEDYYNLDYEDIIGGGQVKTRFSYKKVVPRSFGLDDEEVLLMEDKQLNKLVSLKKYRTYTEEDDHKQDQDLVNMHRVINLKKEVKGEVEQKRKLLK